MYIPLASLPENRVMTDDKDIRIVSDAQHLLSALAAPFAADEVKFLPKAVHGNKALALPYVDARCIMDRLDATVGIDGWSDDYAFLPDGSVLCKLSIRIGKEWVTKMDVGSPSEQPDKHDQTKAAVSDALKRTAVKFGIGRYLYRLPQQWCDYDPQKKKFIRPPTLPAGAFPKPVPLPPAPARPPIELVCQAEFEELDRLIRETHTDPQKFIGWCAAQLGHQVEDVQFLPTSFFSRARALLLKKQAKQAS